MSFVPMGSTIKAPQSTSSATGAPFEGETSACEGEEVCIAGGRVSEAGKLCSGCTVSTPNGYRTCNSAPLELLEADTLLARQRGR